MKLKLDENLSHHLKPRLAALQHDVSTAGDEGPISQSDSAVVAACRAEGRMLLTLDRGLCDVRMHPPGTHPGVLVFRPPTVGPLATMDYIERFVRDNDLAQFVGCSVVVEPGRTRVRRPP